MPNHEFGDDDPTPPHGIPRPLSATAVNLYDLAVEVVSLADNLRRTASVLDGLEGASRAAEQDDLERRLTRVGYLILRLAESVKRGL